MVISQNDVRNLEEAEDLRVYIHNRQRSVEGEERNGEINKQELDNRYESGRSDGPHPIPGLRP